jgi:hypothetical protein
VPLNVCSGSIVFEIRQCAGKVALHRQGDRVPAFATNRLRAGGPTMDSQTAVTTWPHTNDSIVDHTVCWSSGPAPGTLSEPQQLRPASVSWDPK